MALVLQDMFDAKLDCSNHHLWLLGKWQRQIWLGNLQCCWVSMWLELTLMMGRLSNKLEVGVLLKKITNFVVTMPFPRTTCVWDQHTFDVELHLSHISGESPFRVTERLFCLTGVDTRVCPSDFGQCEDPVFFNLAVLKGFALSDPEQKRVLANGRGVNLCVWSETLW